MRWSNSAHYTSRMPMNVGSREKGDRYYQIKLQTSSGKLNLVVSRLVDPREAGSKRAGGRTPPPPRTIFVDQLTLYQPNYAS